MINNCQEDSKARSRTFFTGISLKELFSTSEEWHAFLIGLFEILCPFPTRFGPYWKFPENEGDPSSESVSKEYHYYSFGRGMAVPAWIAIAKLIQLLFW